MSTQIRRAPLGRLTRRRGIAAGLVAATAGAMAVATVGAGSAGATTPQYSAYLLGQWSTVAASLNGSLFASDPNVHLVIGAGEAAANSSSLKQVNTYNLPAGVGSAARIDDLLIGAAPLNFSPLSHSLATAPIGSPVNTTAPAALNLDPLIDFTGAQTATGAAWGPKVTGAGVSTGILAAGNGSVSTINLLNLASLAGPFKALLPKQLQHPLVTLNATALAGAITTTPNGNGTHGIAVAGKGGLGDIQILGGAANGGITLDLFSDDQASRQYVAQTKVWATGLPGGAGCSYTAPDWAQVAVGTANAGIPIGTGTRINFPGKLGYLEFDFTSQAHCSAAANGTTATVTGGGVGIRLHVQNPSNGAGIGDATISLPELDSATISVPVGGIRPS